MSIAHGQNKLRRLFNKLQDQLLDEADEALRETLADIAQEAVNRAPVDTGDLRKSVFIEAPRRQRNKASAPFTVGFSVSYAMAVHERTELKHEVGEAKYLWNAMKAKAPNWAAEMSKRANRQARLKIGRNGMVDI